MIIVQGWKFVTKLAGPSLMEHFHNTGDYNMRNGIVATKQLNDYMDEFHVSFVPLSADDPSKVFINSLLNQAFVRLKFPIYR